MKITTLHTLTFVVKTTGDDCHKAAMTIITRGAAGFGLNASLASMPLAEGADPGIRHTEVKISGDNERDLETYGLRATEALEFIGAEPQS